MIPRGFVFLLACICLLTPSSADGQWLEKTIYLPDSLGGSGECTCVLYNSAHQTVYVGSGAGVAPGTIHAIDASTGVKTARIPLRSAPRTMCLSPDESKLYCALGGERPAFDSVVAVVDCARNVVTGLIQVGSYPRALCLNLQTGRLYTANYGYSGHRDSTLSIIDTDHDSVVATVRLPGEPTDICWDSARNKVYVSTVARSSVVVLDGDADTVVSVIEMPSAPQEVRYVAGYDKVYCTMPGFRSVAVINCNSDSIVATVYEPQIDPQSFCSNAGLGLGYLIGARDKVGVLDLHADTLLRVLEISDPHDGPPRVAVVNPDEDKLYVAQYRFDDHHYEVAVVDCISHSLIARVDVGIGPWALALDWDHNRLYCAAREMSVAVVDCGSDSLAGVVYVGFGASKLLYVAAADRLYALQGGSLGAVCVFDGSSGASLDVIRTARRGRDICLNTVDNKLYVANGLSRSLSVIAVDGDSLLPDIPVAPDPKYLVYHPDLNRLYCGSAHTTITAVCGRTDTIIRVTELLPGAPACIEALVCVPDVDRLYGWMLVGSNRYIFAYDCIRDTVVAWLNRGPGPAAGTGIVYCEEYKKVYAGDAGRNIHVVDALVDTFLYERQLGGRYPIGTRLCLVPGTGELYVPDITAGVVEILDCGSDSVVGRISTDRPGSGLHFDAGSNKVYFGLETGGIGVVDVLTREVTARFPGPDGGRFASDSVRKRVYVGTAGLSCLAVFRDSVVPGVSENPPTREVLGKPGPTIIRAVLHMPETEMTNAQYPMTLLDVTGRRVMDLQPGDNDIRHISPGAYFVREASGVERQASSVRKVILTH